MNHEDEIKDYERRLQGMSDAVVQKDANASKLRAEIDSLRLTNQRLEAEVKRMKEMAVLIRDVKSLSTDHSHYCDCVKCKQLEKLQGRLRDLESQKGQL